MFILTPFVLLTASGNFKNWKEEGDNMHCKYVIFEIQNENGFSTAAFYLTVNKKITHSH